MQVLIGGVLGTVAGLGTWYLVRHFSVRYGVPSEAGQATRQEHPEDGTRGAVAAPFALTVAGMAAWGAYAGWQAPSLQEIVAAILVTGLLLAISLVDFKTKSIPNALVVALLLMALVQIIVLGQPDARSAALGLAAAGGLFLLLARIRPGAMGLGDVKLAAALGAVLGLPLIISGLLYGILAGGAAALFLLVTRRAGRKDTLAYGPYLALGAWIAWTQWMGLWG